MKGNVQGSIDAASIAIWVFWIFFAGLIVYLRREDRREGYPLFSEPSNTYKPGDSFFIPPPKTFILPHGGTVQAPNGKPDDRPIRAEKTFPWPGAPLEPTGDPMLAAVGPGAYAERANVPDLTVEGQPKIVPLRSAPSFSIAVDDRDPRGFAVMGYDGEVAGKISDVWVDRSEVTIRYLEIELTGAKRVLVPVTFAMINQARGTVTVDAVASRHFAQVPVTAKPDQVTLLEEEKISAYYGGGTLYAHPSRTEPLL